MKSSVRCKVEHVFARVKLQMSYSKTRYRGIAKNTHRINTMLALCNLFTVGCFLRRLKV
ncbi:transposase [Sutterella seckii]|uniref:transposase n=1 Tax=Sutterella seckii TaxID=1944635 RepID=UPI001D0449BA|nr:transposase [Sutterella seckii]